MTLDLRQEPPRPANPRPIVIIGCGGIVAAAHLPAYRKAGFTVAGLYDLDRARAEATVRELGGSSFAVPGDLETEGVAESLIERTIAEFGRLDILVNNAAMPLTTRFEQITPDEWRRAVEVTDAHPYHELTRYLAVHRERVDAAFRTLSYCDGLNFAVRASAPALFSVGLMDEICPPSTVFAAYNHYAGPREIRVWPYNGHEAGDRSQQAERYAFLESVGLAPSL